MGPVTLTTTEARALLPLAVRKLRGMRTRYDSPRQVERRAQLAAEGRRDAAEHAIELMERTVARLREAAE